MKHGAYNGREGLEPFMKFYLDHLITENNLGRCHIATGFEIAEGTCELSIYRDGKPLLLGFISSEKSVGFIREYAQRQAHIYKDMFDQASCFGYSTSSADKLVIQFFESHGEEATELGIPTALSIRTSLDYLKDYEEITKNFRNTTQKETGKEKEETVNPRAISLLTHVTIGISFIFFISWFTYFLLSSFTGDILCPGLFSGWF